MYRVLIFRLKQKLKKAFYPEYCQLRYFKGKFSLNPDYAIQKHGII